MRSAFAPPLRIAGRIIGAMETIDAMKLWERANPRKKAQLLDAGERAWELCGLRGQTVESCNAASPADLE